MKKIFLLMRFILCAAAAAAQPVIAFDGGAPKISSMDIKIWLMADNAVTRYDIVLSNPSAGILEGEFDFKLQGTQNADSFTVDGEARHAADGLKTELLLPPEGERRIQIVLEEKLQNKDGAYYYELPAAAGFKAEDFRLRAEVLRQAAAPEIKANSFDGFEFARRGGAYAATFGAKDYEPAGSLAFAAPAEAAAKAFTYYADGNTYFFAAAPFEPETGVRNKFKKITLMWDNAPAAQNAQGGYLAFLDEFFDIYQNIKVDFMTFDGAARRAFKISGGDWRALKDFISALAYDGGAPQAAAVKGDAALLFYGAPAQSLPALKIKTFPIAAADSQAEAPLKNAALKTGGFFVNLGALGPARAARAVAAQHYMLQSISYDKTKFDEVYPAAPVTAQHILYIAGIINVKEARLDLHFTAAGRPDIVKRIYIDGKARSPYARGVFLRAAAAR
ncbi:MAG: hypothetical protein LBL61_02265 [Elusimicrobiota bacterium]|jgi:hypothetical protein|nr:hypothetical protein [Elusimicrobiota bacterium]